MLRATLVRVVESRNPVGLALRLVRRLYWVARLGTSGLFDLTYYRAQRGEHFGYVHALWDFLSAGPDSPLSFHPLVDGAWIQSHTRRPGRTWFVTLFAPGAAATSTSPVFDVMKASRSGRDSSARVLKRFLASADPEITLPVAEESATGTTYARAVSIAMEAARESALQSFRTRPRESSSWDASAASRFLAGVPVIERADAPIVTVVMPARDRADTIESAIRSVLAQTYSGWRLIVIDDGSRDATSEIVRTIDDERIVLLSTAGVGVSAARNLGVRASTTEFLAFLDADNRWTPEFLAGCLGHLLEVGATYAYSAVRREEGDEVRFLGGASQYEELRDGANVVDLNVLVARRDAVVDLGAFDERLRRWVDYDLVLRLARSSQGVYCPFVGVVYDHRSSRTDRITNVESRSWRNVVLERHLVDWESAPIERVPDRLSVVIVAQGDLEWTLGTVRNLLESAEEEDVEVVVVDGGSSASFARTLRLCFAARPVTIVRLSRDHGYAVESNIGIERTTGEYVVLVNHVAKVARGWARRIRDALRDSNTLAVQPLLRKADGTVESAGTLFFGAGRLPAPFLEGFPIEDALRADAPQRRALSGMFLAMRANDLLRLRGMDPHFPSALSDADLCLRLTASRSGVLRVLLSEVVTVQDATQARVAPLGADRALALERWQDADLPDESLAYRAVGFELAGDDDGHEEPELLGSPRLVRRDFTYERWAIKIAAPAAMRGDAWGDRYFADDLAAALSRQGIHTAVDRREGAHRETAGFDDVAIFIRGTAPVEPVSGVMNVLWVISHPDDVTIDEVRSFDLVFAASARWAAWMSVRSGRHIEVLLQATDATVFSSGDSVRGGCVFVGSTRGQQRPIVNAAALAGLPLRVFGRGWEATPVADHVVSWSLARDDVADEYRRADLVLNDHWPDMASWGFVSNRVFDAVASGARVISDPVDGMADLFGDAVLVLDEPREIADFLDRAPAVTSRDRQTWSEEVRSQHSFTRRAEQLVSAVHAHRRGADVTSSSRAE